MRKRSSSLKEVTKDAQKRCGGDLAGGLHNAQDYTTTNRCCESFQ